MRYLLLIVALIGAGCSSGGSSSDGVAPPTLVPTDQPLQPGDMIGIAFTQERQLNGQFPVDETRHVSLPLLGNVDVAGLSGTELRAELAREYETQIRNQTVQVTLLRRVRVLGAVQSPGLYHVDPTMRLIDAIALAGGPTSDGKLDGVDILRSGEVAAENVAETELVGSYVQSGDQIMVPLKSWLSRNAAWVFASAISATAIVYAAIINTSN